ncbi:hypothetical protein SAMN05216388_1017104 [Halorientalis persicus]|uniref:Uncharacterized protein n=1 Tax=Halorientalis persicus TaxID=1367881 RepID=A0A1H8S1V8_9EURY|nr:hypothetical protein [Halorientalis persicus]SEO72163.1 hypothetical protein SAMN05216388_1017104 [Halorientalis persicus]
MPQTYTSPTLTVSNGEITSHDTADVADGISILSAECRWQGVTTTETNTSWNTYLDDTRDNNPDSQTYVTHELTQPLEGTEQKDFRAVAIIGVELPDDTGYGFNFRLLADNDGDGDFEQDIRNKGSKMNSFYESHDVKGDTLQNPPDGMAARIFPNAEYNGKLHYLGWENRDLITLDYISAGIEYRYKSTVTVTEQTTDPFATRDVDGAYSGTLSDGEWSPWVTLNGLQTGVNEFYHNISGSNEAKFEFRYDWEYTFPEPVGGLLSVGARDGSQLHRVALADPSSSRLAYNHVRVLVGGTAYAIDVVDPSDPDAIDWFRLGTQHGVVCPRAYQTESV